MFRNICIAWGLLLAVGAIGLVVQPQIQQWQKHERAKAFQNEVRNCIALTRPLDPSDTTRCINNATARLR
jgi:hypothetical protein